MANLTPEQIAVLNVLPEYLPELRQGQIAGNFKLGDLLSTTQSGTKASVTLTAAQVIALNATPISLIPAVNGKLIEVGLVTVAYKYGSAAFTIGASKHIQVIYTGGAVAGQVDETGLLDQVVNKENAISCGNYSPVRGAGVLVTSDDATILLGTGCTVTVNVYYTTRA